MEITDSYSSRPVHGNTIKSSTAVNAKDACSYTWTGNKWDDPVEISKTTQ